MCRSRGRPHSFVGSISVDSAWQCKDNSSPLVGAYVREGVSELQRLDIAGNSRRLHVAAYGCKSQCLQFQAILCFKCRLIDVRNDITI